MASKNIADKNQQIADFLLPNGLTIEETEAATAVIVEEIYIKAFASNVAIHYKDGRCNNKTEFIEAKPDGSEDLVWLDEKTDMFNFLKHLLPPKLGKWAYLLNDPRYFALKQTHTQIFEHA